MTNRIVFLDYLRVLACFMVIVVHSCEPFYLGGDGLEIGFNDRYLMDALKASGKDELHVCLNTASSPCVIKAADGSEGFTYMILPVRLRSGD